MWIKHAGFGAVLALGLAVSACSGEGDSEPSNHGSAGTGQEQPGIGGSHAEGAGGTGGEEPGDDRVEPPKEGPAMLYGSELSEDDNFVYFDDLMAAPAEFDGKNIKTEGVVRVNCNKRGCWMEVRSAADANSNGLTVRFVDYSFFVPLDSRGASVRIEGIPAVTVLTKDEVDHYRSEGYDLHVNEDGTADIVNFTATGVEMWQKK